MTKSADSTQVVRFTTFKIDSARRRRSEDGALIVPGRLARVGIQTYDQGGGKQLREYRPAAEVFDDAAIASFDGLTITDLHPASGMVTPDSFRELSRGHVQAPRQDGDWLAVDFYIKDAETIRAVEAGDREELSAGYLAHLDMTPGTDSNGAHYDAVQRDIRGNHAALLPAGQARAGRHARLLDSTNNEMPPTGREKTMDEFEITLGGITYTVSGDAAAKQAIDQYMADASGWKSAADQEKARADEAEQKADRAEQALADAVDPSRIEEAAHKRAELVAHARKVARDDSLDSTGTDREIMVRALDAAGVDSIGAKSDDYITARFDAKLEDADKAPAKNTINNIADSMTQSTPANKPRRFAKLAAARNAALEGTNG